MTCCDALQRLWWSCRWSVISLNLCRRAIAPAASSAPAQKPAEGSLQFDVLGRSSPKPSSHGKAGKGPLLPPRPQPRSRAAASGHSQQQQAAPSTQQAKSANNAGEDMWLEELNEPALTLQVKLPAIIDTLLYTLRRQCSTQQRHARPGSDAAGAGHVWSRQLAQRRRRRRPGHRGNAAVGSRGCGGQRIEQHRQRR